MHVKPAKILNGSVVLPGDKSISHRSAILAAIADGTTSISNYLAAEDCLSTLECLRALGVSIDRNGTDVVVVGAGRHGLTEPLKELDCGNSGTTARTISGILAGQKFSSIITGDASLSIRPMRRIIDPLTRMGAMIIGNDGRLPLKFAGNANLTGISHQMSVASAQVKTCIMLAGLYADGQTTVIEPTISRDHTERMLEWFGVDVSIEMIGSERHISLNGASKLTAKDITVPGDISSSAFLLVAAACIPGSRIELENVGLNPTRTGIIEVLNQFGVNVEIQNKREQCNEPVGDLIVRGSEISRSNGPRPILNGFIIANIIDEIPILAILGTQLENGLEIRGASELRVKETDRIDAVVKNLRAVGATVDEFDDGLRIHRSNIIGGRVPSFGDHRIAMAFAIAGLLSSDGVEIDDAACTDISFPAFFEVLGSLVR